MKRILIIFAIVFVSIYLLQPTLAHQSGCHSWHSCPSDSGSYVCGDRGYCSQCPDNEYCSNGKYAPNVNQTQIVPYTTESTTQTPEGVDEPETEVPQITIEPGEITEIDVTIPVECKGTFKGIVERIVDGDTLVIDGCNESVRLSLVNTPETYDPTYKESKTFTESLCKVGSVATVDQDSLQPYDRYGRIVAVVYCENRNLNAELIYNNLAEIYTQYCGTSEFSNEDWAEDYGCGAKRPVQTTTISEKESTSEQQLTETKTTIESSTKSFIDVFVEFLTSLFRFN